MEAKKKWVKEEEKAGDGEEEGDGGKDEVEEEEEDKRRRTKGDGAPSYLLGFFSAHTQTYKKCKTKKKKRRK